MTVRRFHMSVDRTRQKQKAFHMLILSGVVRPSHIGLRYLTFLTQGEEPTTDSQHSSHSPAQILHNFYRLITALWQKRITRLLSREPQYIQPCLFKPCRATTSQMWLRS